MRAHRQLTPLAALAVALTGGACSDPPMAAAPPTPPAPSALGPTLGGGSAGRYWEGFDFLFGASGAPLTGGWPSHAPAPWTPTDFDVVIHSRDRATWYAPEPFRAMHGTGCEPYQNPEPADDVRPGDTGSHEVRTYDDLNYRCRNHMMTALGSSGYGVIYLTPNAMADWATGEAVVKFAMSTLRTSGGDWVDLWVTPWKDNLVLPLDGSLVGTDLQGPPRTAIHIRMAAEGRKRTRFEAYYVRDFVEAKLPVLTTDGYETILEPVSTRRDTFELRLGRYRVRFGMKKIASPNGPAGSITWLDVPLRLGFTRGVVQFGHHSSNPALDGGTAGTWHWDDFTIAPAVPFTIITPRRGRDGRRRHVDAATAHLPVEFERDAPAGAFLRFAAYGTGIQLSVDGGATWTNARRQPAALDRPDRFRSYWTPIPAGTSAVLFRAAPGIWLVRDVTIWSR